MGKKSLATTMALLSLLIDKGIITKKEHVERYGQIAKMWAKSEKKYMKLIKDLFPWYWQKIKESKN